MNERVLAQLRVLRGLVAVGVFVTSCAASDGNVGTPATTAFSTTTESPTTTTEALPELILAEDAAYVGRATTYLAYRIEVEKLVITNLAPRSYLAGDTSEPTAQTRLIAEFTLTNNSEGRTDNPDRIISVQTPGGDTLVPVDLLDQDGNPSSPRIEARSTIKGIVTFPYSEASVDGATVKIGELGKIPATIDLTAATEVTEPEPFRIPLPASAKIQNLQAPSKGTCNFEFAAQVLEAGIVLDGVAGNRPIRARPDERFLELDLEVTNRAPNGRPEECGPMTGNDMQLRLIVDGIAINQINALDFRPIAEGETVVIRSYFLLQPGASQALKLTNLIGSDIVRWVVTIPEELTEADEG